MEGEELVRSVRRSLGTYPYCILADFEDLAVATNTRLTSYHILEIRARRRSSRNETRCPTGNSL